MKTVIVAAITADGFIARHATQVSTEWTSPEDKTHFRDLTKELGTLVMGSTTFDTIGRALPGRRMIVMTRRPAKYDIEGIETFSGSAAELYDQLEAEGVPSLAVLGGATVYGQFMAARLVDELVLTVEPHTFGAGIPLLGESADFALKLRSVDRLGENAVILHYNVER